MARSHWSVSQPPFRERDSSRGTFDAALVRFRQHSCAAGVVLVRELRFVMRTGRWQILVRFRLAVRFPVLCVTVHVELTTLFRTGSWDCNWAGFPLFSMPAIKECSMPIQICTTCGTSYPDASEPPDRCLICEDERQFVP